MSARRLDFKVTGSAVNEACRLEELCKRLAVPVVVSAAAAGLGSARLRPLGRHAVPGVGRAMDVFTLPAGSLGRRTPTGGP